ncbi:MAG: hypothetical protein DWB45_03820 [Xanthomonadales bacterium]|nr:hypothetical protein [Xanthomonadales bacterium]MCC6597050.1 hypothetical protein [Rhodanobacteraceae bacterium]MDL1868138.1 hypothetical protein [Gammaproteobacteria bacterium PRO6]
MKCVSLNKVRVCAFVAAGGLLAAGSALAENLNFTLVNNTGYPINEVYVSSAATKSWEEDVMGRDQLGDGDGVDIRFDPGEKGCLWDLKVVYEDDESAVWDRLDLCELSKVTLHYDRDKGSTWADTE